MISPWVSAWPYRDEAIITLLIRHRAAGTGKVWIERRIVIIIFVLIPACGIGLPQLDQCVAHRFAIFIQNPSGKMIFARIPAAGR